MGGVYIRGQRKSSDFSRLPKTTISGGKSRKEAEESVTGRDSRAQKRQRKSSPVKKRSFAGQKRLSGKTEGRRGGRPSGPSAFSLPLSGRKAHRGSSASERKLPSLRFGASTHPLIDEGIKKTVVVDHLPLGSRRGARWRPRGNLPKPQSLPLNLIQGEPEFSESPPGPR